MTAPCPKLLIHSQSPVLFPLPLVKASDLNEAQFQEFQSLSCEKDPQIFWQDLYGFGLRLDAEQRPEAAVQVYSAVAGGQGSEFLRSEASSRLQAMQGRGSVARRFEFLLPQLTRESSNPATILPMILGTTVYGLVRAATLARWTGVSTNLLRRGFGARMAAVSMASLAEASSFVLSSRSLRRWAGDSKNELSFKEELATTALTLGVLKFTGTVAQVALNRQNVFLSRIRHQESLSLAVSLGAQFGGLIGARALEESVGFRAPVDGATKGVDALASIFSMSVGSHAGQRLLGSRFARFQRELNLQVSKTEERQVTDLALASAFGFSSVGGGGIPRFLGGRRSRSFPVGEVRDQLLSDLASLRDELNPLAEKIPGLNRRMETRFEYGDSIRRQYREGRDVYHWESETLRGISEATGRAEYEAYLAWRKAAGLPEGPSLAQDSAEILGLAERLQLRHVELKMESRVSGAQIAYVSAIFDLLPPSFFRNHYVRRLTLGVPNASDLEIGNQFRGGDVRISKATLRSSRRLLAATILHELGHSVDIRYASNLAEISAVGIGNPSMGGPLLPDFSIPREVRQAMHRHYEVIRRKEADSFAMNVFDDTGRSDWEVVGFSRRRKYVIGSFPEFMAEYVLHYVASGAELRRFIHGPAQTDVLRRAYRSIYEELRDRVFEGKEYDEHGMIGP